MANMDLGIDLRVYLSATRKENFMKTSKETLPLYHFSENGEWASIGVLPSEIPRDGGEPRQGGLLMIHSSFGSFSHHWSSCGMDFRRFLGKIDVSYFASKVRGAEAEVFDPERTRTAVLALTEEIAEEVRSGEMPGVSLEDLDADLETLRDFADEIDAEWTTSHFLNELATLSFDHAEVDFSFLGERVLHTRLDPQITQFWETFWPALNEVLATEMAAEMATEQDNDDADKPAPISRMKC